MHYRSHLLAALLTGLFTAQGVDLALSGSRCYGASTYPLAYDGTVARRLISQYPWVENDEITARYPDNQQVRLTLSSATGELVGGNTLDVFDFTDFSADAPRGTVVHVQGSAGSSRRNPEEKAENEGLRITTTNGSRNRTVAKAASNTFDKGKALFVTAVYVFIIALAECIVNLCLQGVMHSHAAYVVIPFVIDFVMLGIFLFLYLRGYGKNSRKTQSKSYISATPPGFPTGTNQEKTLSVIPVRSYIFFWNSR